MFNGKAQKISLNGDRIGHRRRRDVDDLRVQAIKKKRNAMKNHLNLRIEREKEKICEQRLEKKQMSNTLTFSDMQTEIPWCKWISIRCSLMQTICRQQWKLFVTRWYHAVREDREEKAPVRRTITITTTLFSSVCRLVFIASFTYLRRKIWVIHHQCSCLIHFSRSSLLLSSSFTH
jgi:hypothetical protein